MRRSVSLILILSALVLGQVSGAPPVRSEIASPRARADVIASAEKLLEPRQYKYGIEPAQLKNPFSPPQPQVATGEPTKNSRPASDQDFVTLLAAQLNPTGVLMLNGESLLLFGEKKVKVGDTIRITFDKEIYEVELVDLSRTAFTIKLNNAEVTRSIKPAKSP